jgi:hypothetical protein
MYLDNNNQISLEIIYFEKGTKTSGVAPMTQMTKH